MPSQNLRLPPLIRDLEIDYTALSFVAPQKVQFRYKLESRDETWQEPKTRRQAFYSDLPPGSYKFRVIASNNDGVWNEEGAAWNFIVPPAYYQTTWFRLACALSGLSIIWLLAWLRVRQIAAEINARFDERLGERTRLARELHDTFLQTVQASRMVADDALEQPADPVRMRRALERLSVWLARATEEARTAVNSLRTSTVQENDLAKALRDAGEECLLNKSMSFEVSVEGPTKDMHPIIRDEVYRIGYEAIRNACAHSAGSRLDVTLSYAQDLALSVLDNGKGIDSQIVATGKLEHFGLKGMQERASRIRGRLTISGSAKTGTKVELIVPGKIAFREPVRDL